MENIFRYPKGHPCYGCTHTFHVYIPSCSIGCDANNCSLRELEKHLRSIDEPAKPKQNSAATEKIFKFIEVLKKVRKRKGY